MPISHDLPHRFLAAPPRGGLSSKKIADNNEVYREIVGDDGKELLAVIEEEIRAIELAGEEVDIPLLNLKFYLETGIAPD